ncbi:polymer-forming cytoskeletal protein [Janthinobacterium sp. GW460P]|uniref:polymer-forming cytoskeletal protein n=1 Tax=unclassified Janthinobacterium TaxID=2610881 RepID=UPI00111BE423|nr:MULTISPECIES: polymer-forming cytoskeletal protein [unclassified Janthinobacterium]MCC7704313.1 polymer-forming cytoskeletal protein [Janthinobacterium sp. GW460P]MCC7709635.1 polymer-forming cytoskeletal protein [Janthinobacterium sp. GW460W]
MGSSLVHAATLNFNGGAVSGCSLPASSTQYTCATLLMGSTDNVVIASGYGVTVNSDVSIGYNQGLSMSGTAALTANRNIDISNVNPPNLKITGGSLTAKGGNFNAGSQGGTVLVADISAASVSLGGTPVKVTGNITATGNIDISSGSTLTGAISGGSISSNSNVTISGSVKATGSVSIGSSSTIAGPISGSAVSTSSSVTITGDVTAVNSFSLGSGSSLTGTTTAPVVSIDASNSKVQGDITASTSLSVGSGSQVKGNLTSPTIDLKASGLLVTGDVKALTSLSIASGNGIKGNVEGGNVTLDSSNAYITGNALVDHITLGWQGRVQQTITCKAYTPSNPCSCVTNNSGWPYTDPLGPKCGPGTPSGLHHFQIEHPGTALTCAPQTVTVTACADAACSARYTGGATVTVSPGGTATPIGNSGVATASVRQYTVGTATLSLTSVPGTTGALVCKRAVGASSSCDMAFAETGLTVIPVNHVSAKPQAFDISAVQAGPDAQACVPLFKNTSKDLTLSCSYSNPASGTLPVLIKGTGGFVPLAASASSACSATGQSVNLAFDNTGVATAIMSYADVGKLNLTATYTGSATTGDVGLSMKGSADVVVVPASFSISAIASPQRAGAPVMISARALNNLKALTPNFGNEKLSETVLPSLASLVKPAETDFSDRAKPAMQGSVVFANGSVASSDMSWPEVGTITIALNLANRNGYLDANIAVPTLLKASGLSDEVRFIPHHFITELIKNGAAESTATPCAAPLTCADDGEKGRYAYSGQAIGVRVTARALGEATTQNYDERNPTVLAPVLLDGWDAATGKISFPPSTSDGSSRLTDGKREQNTVTGVAPAKFILGVASSLVAYRFPGKAGVPAKVAPTDVRLRASSTYPDGAIVNSTSPVIQNEARMTVLSGQWMVPHSYGSELLPVRLAVQVQYWNGTKWVTNLLDSISAIKKTDVVLANCKKTLDCAKLAVDDRTYTVAQGTLPKANLLTLLAPGANNSGSVDVSATKHPYLASTVGVVVFGILRSGPVIYLREIY